MCKYIVYVNGYVHMGAAAAYRGKKKESGTLLPELQAIVSHLILILRIEHKTSGTATSAHNHWGISPKLQHVLRIKNLKDLKLYYKIINGIQRNLVNILFIHKNHCEVMSFIVWKPMIIL